jgi:hypothetical protein
MRVPKQQTLLTILMIALLGCGLSLLLLTGIALPPIEASQAATQRWEAYGLNSYRISVRVEYRGETCFQQFTVRFGRVSEIARNSCNEAWLDILAVPELFELAQQIEDIPQNRCYPSSRWCVCQRSFSSRMIEFDEQLGYPRLILSRSDLHPNWLNFDFWERFSQTHSMPSCGPAPRRLTIEVIALTPLT